MRLPNIHILPAPPEKQRKKNGDKKNGDWRLFSRAFRKTAQEKRGLASSFAAFCEKRACPRFSRTTNQGAH